ncbi:hypothetical protein Ddye_008012 [Dipteronia dyeriana]|uniref:HMA domain-containing protein n=1 Tax=Dipteronia dyeriana TaxID=168575 RepID=A0AAD9X8P8_9ROSI|nr:hypothetical protein Ddye_008012 [Dipteronia dyeriana]
MGEEKDVAKNDGEKKAAPAAADTGAKKDDGVVVVVLKMDLHCEGCAKKIRRCMKNFGGVTDVKTDMGANKVTVTGKVDPAKVKARLEEKSKKKVELISPQLKKDAAPAAGGGDKKPEAKSDKKPEEKKSDDKKPEPPKEVMNHYFTDLVTIHVTVGLVLNYLILKFIELFFFVIIEMELFGCVSLSNSSATTIKKLLTNLLINFWFIQSTVVLKIRLHCEGCINKIKRIISKIKGVANVTVDKAKELVTVKGTMDTKELVPHLKEKLKRAVEVVAPAAKKDDGGEKKDKKEAGGGDKKENKDTGGGDKKAAAPAPADKGGEKDKAVAAPAAAAGGDAAKMEVSKMEYYGYPYPQPPSYWYDGHVYGQQQQAMDNNHQVVYMNQGYMMDHHNPQYNPQYNPQQYNQHYQTPQMFSDENPNACSVM